MGSLAQAVGNMPQRGRNILTCLLAATFLAVLYSTRYSYLAEPYSHLHSHNTVIDPQLSKLYGKDYRGRSSPAEINRVTNDTLGFSKIFAVGLPERSDKRDALTLTAALTGFHVE